MDKVKKAYAERTNKTSDTSQTPSTMAKVLKTQILPNSLKMANNDMIEVFFEQVGSYSIDYFINSSRT